MSLVTCNFERIALHVRTADIHLGAPAAISSRRTKNGLPAVRRGFQPRLRYLATAANAPLHHSSSGLQAMPRAIRAKPFSDRLQRKA